MTSRTMQVRMIFDASGEPIKMLVQNGGGKTYFMDVEPSKDSSIDEFLKEVLCPPETKTE